MPLSARHIHAKTWEKKGTAKIKKRWMEGLWAYQNGLWVNRNGAWVIMNGAWANARISFYFRSIIVGLPPGPLFVLQADFLDLLKAIHYFFPPPRKVMPLMLLHVHGSCGLKWDV